MSAPVDNFANHPASITETRAEKSGSSADWTPRDVLISVLREIDEGKAKPKTLVICYTELEEEGGLPAVTWQMASKGIIPALGLLTRVAYRINGTADEDADL